MTSARGGGGREKRGVPRKSRMKPADQRNHSLPVDRILVLRRLLYKFTIFDIAGPLGTTAVIARSDVGHNTIRTESNNDIEYSSILTSPLALANWTPK